jgi:hypothetical protein
VSWRAELAVLASGVELAEQELVEVTLYVLVLRRDLHSVDGFTGFYEQAGLVDLELGVNFLAFLRHLLALDTIPDYPQVVQRGFERHIQAHNYNAEQIRFLRSVQEVFLAKRTLVEADLYDPPLTNFGRNAVERFFTPKDIGELLDLTKSLAA